MANMHQPDTGLSPSLETRRLAYTKPVLRTMGGAPQMTQAASSNYSNNFDNGSGENFYS